MEPELRQELDKLKARTRVIEIAVERVGVELPPPPREKVKSPEHDSSQDQE